MNLFRLFVTELLPLLRTKVILLTGQWLKPALELLAPGRTKLPDSHQNRLGFVTSGDVEATLRSDRIVRWYSQNMFAVPTTYQDKYRGLPYGIDYTKAEQYRKCLRDFGNVPKKDTLFLSPLRNTSKVREVLLNLSEYRNAMRAFTGKNGARRIENYSYYCERLARARFVISPEGDRPDCFRHWEAADAARRAPSGSRHVHDSQTTTYPTGGRLGRGARLQLPRDAPPAARPRHPRLEATRELAKGCSEPPLP